MSLPKILMLVTIIAGIVFFLVSPPVGKQLPDLSEVLKQCESDNEDERVAAIASLAKYPESFEETAPVVARFSASVSEMERGAAELAIKQMGVAMLEHVVPLLDSNESVDVNGACNAFAIVGGQTKVGDEGLFRLVNSDDPRKNFLGLKALQSMGKTAVPVLERVTQLLDSKDFNVQLRACNVLAAVGADAEPALDELLRIADEGNLSVRSSAMIPIGAIGSVSDDPRILEKLSEKLDEFHVLEKERSLKGVALMGPKAKSLMPKIEALMTDVTKSMMPEAAFAFVQMGGDIKRAEGVFVSLQDDFTYQTRVLVQIEKLGVKATPKMLEIVIAKLNSPEPSVRESAILALVKMGKPAKTAVSKLTKIAQSDEDSLVQETAKQAIEILEAIQ